MKQPLNEQFGIYNRRRAGFLRRHALLLAGATLLVVAIAAITLDVLVILPPAIRVATLVAMALAGVGILLHRWLQPAKLLTNADAAKTIEENFPELGQLLRTSLEAEQQDGNLTGANPALLGAVQKQAAATVQKADLESTIPWQKCRPALIACIIAVLVILTAATTSSSFRTAGQRLLAPTASIPFTNVTAEATPTAFRTGDAVVIAAQISGRKADAATLKTRRLTAETWQTSTIKPQKTEQGYEWTLQPDPASFEYQVFAGDGKTEIKPVDFREPPIVEETKAIVHSPSYTGQEPLELDTGTLSAIAGSRIELHWTISTPLADAAVLFSDDTEIPVERNGTQVTANIIAQRGKTTWQLVGVSEGNLHLTGPKETITAIPDKLPKVSILDPASDLSVTKVWEMPVSIRVADDFGIAEAGITLRIGGEEKEVWHQAYTRQDNQRTLAVSPMLYLEQYPLEINDNVQLYAWAKDFHDGRSGRGLSRIVSIDIRPFREDWTMQESQESEEESESGEQLLKLEEIISDERKILSETFPLSETVNPPTKKTTRLKQMQSKTGIDLMALHEEMQGNDDFTEDDLALMDIAHGQMQDAITALEQRNTKNAFADEDAALTNLIETRKRVIKAISKSDSKSKSKSKQQNQQPPPVKSLQDLAKMARGIAATENELSADIKKETQSTSAETLQSIQRNAVSEAGELHDALITHPEASALLLERMADAEDQAYAGQQQLESQSEDTQKTLAAAAEKFNQLAEHLEGLDQANKAETLEKMQEMAEESAEELEQQQSEQQQPAQQQSAQQQSAQQQSAQQQSAQQQSEQQQSEQQQSEQQQSEQQQSEQQQSEQQQSEQQQSEQQQSEQQQAGQQQSLPSAEKLDELANQAETLNDWLEKMRDAEGDEEKKKRLDDLAQDNKTNELSQDLEDAAKLAQQGRGKAAQEKAEDLAKRFDELAEQFKREHRAASESRLEQLARAKAKADALKEQSRKERQEQQEAERQQAQQEGQPPGEEPGSTPGGQPQATEGEPAQEPSQAQGSTPAPPSDDAQEPDLADGTEDLQQDIATIPDPKLQDIAKFIPGEGGYQMEFALQALSDALDERIQDILRRQFRADPDEKIPPAYNDLAAEYTRRLSDDLDAE